MYRCIFTNVDNTNQYEELIKVFLQPSEYVIYKSENIEDELDLDFSSEDHIERLVYEGDKDEIKRQLYRSLNAYTGKSPKWGILTGIRPVKLTGEIYREHQDKEKVLEILENDYLLHPNKSVLAADIMEYQLKTAGHAERKSLGLYVGIPFCPTRCLYCSFTSNQVGDCEIVRYLEALVKEIRYCGKAASDNGYTVESVYFGGGTPTTLNAEQLDMLMRELEDNFNLKGIKEYTVEAGRPDTITEEKLRVLKAHGVDRISINPQTMKQDTLDLIGRRHTVDDVYKAFEAAGKVGFNTINVDLIAGLPDESLDDFKSTLDKVMELDADNVTLHTLAVKRASRLKEVDETFNYKDELLREEMLSYAHLKLRAAGYVPYYLYRQKHTSGNTENIGFCREDKINIYNIRMMEEDQSILAMGAGSISKIHFPDENRHERVANVSNYEIYIDRIDEMIERKAKGFFEQK